MMGSTKEISHSSLELSKPRSLSREKTVVTMLIIVGTLSLFRDRFVIELYIERHLRNSRTSHTTKSSHLQVIFQETGNNYHSHPHPRIVFLDGNAWVPTIRDPRINNNLQMYPVQIRRIDITSKTKEEEDLDPTRLYPVGNSEDFPTMERRLWPEHEFDRHCQPSAQWQSTFHPVCNDIHTVVNLHQGLIQQDVTLLSGKGFWRHAWKHEEASHNTTVWKTFKIHHNFEEKFYEDNRVDVVAMERLTHSPYVIRVFGFCGLTVVQEFAGRQLSSVVDAPKVSYIEKLILAKQIAQGLADIHAIPGDDGKIIRPTLVHNDINPANLLFTADGRPVLNDFNIAVLLMKHNETGETCRFYSRFPNPQWKAPEEQVNNDDENTERNPPIVNEKIDIYALGNVFYRIVAGRSPWVRPNKMKFNRDDSGIISKSKRQSGLMPPLPDTIKQAVIHTKNPALIALLDAMRRCYSFDPKDRPSAAEIVEFFDGVIQTMQIHSK